VYRKAPLPDGRGSVTVAPKLLSTCLQPPLYRLADQGIPGGRRGLVCLSTCQRNRIVPWQRFQQSPAATIAFLALALTVAAYAAMRQQAHLAEANQAQSARDLGAEMEKAGLVGAIEEASDAVVITDGEGTIQYVNPAYTRMTGYSAEEVIGHNPHRQKPG
jgi:PAS domain-containing protein